MRRPNTTEKEGRRHNSTLASVFLKKKNRTPSCKPLYASKKKQTVKENFKIIGEWFLPNQNERVHGTLDFNLNGIATLVLYGSLTSDSFLSEVKHQELILGISSKSKKFSLFRCHMTTSEGPTLVQGQEAGKSSVSYSISCIFKGLHVNNLDELKFDTISSEIFNLDEWVGISGFENKRPDHKKNKNFEYSINYKLPESIEFAIDNENIGKFNFSVKPPGFSIYQKSKQIHQTVQFQIQSKNEIAFTELLKKVLHFQNFLILGLYTSTFVTSIVLTGKNHQEKLVDGRLIKKRIELFVSQSNTKTEEKPKSFKEMIFSYHDIKHNFSNIIQQWYAKYELLEPAFNLLFEQFYNKNRFTENTFLNLAQAAETFHARLHNHTKISIEDYRIMKKEILKETDSKYHKWLNDQFSFGNNLNLHTRLSEITEKYSNQTIDKIITDKEEFVKQVKYSRNYYTHYSSGSEKNALKGGELFYLSEKLKLLLACSFLMEVGITKEELSMSLENVKWTLFNHLASW
jgi:hypothetical protein